MSHIGPHSIMRCPDCGDIHSTHDRNWFGQCPGCGGYGGDEVTLPEYEAEVRKQGAYFPALVGVVILQDAISEAYQDAISPIKFLHRLLKPTP